MTTAPDLVRKKQPRTAWRAPGLAKGRGAVRRKIGFREQLTFLIALSLAPFLLLTLLSANRSYDAYRSQLEQTVFLAAELVSAREQLLLEEARQLLYGLGGTAGSTGGGAAGDAAGTEALDEGAPRECASTVPLNPDLARYLVGFQAIGPLGQTVCRYGDDVSVQVSPERFAFRQSSSLVSLMPATEPGKRPIGLLALPWMAGNPSESQGQLIAAIDARAFTAATQDLALPSQISIALIDKDGEHLTLTGGAHDSAPQGAHWLPGQALAPLANNSASAAALTGQDGKERLYIVRQLGESQMLMVAAAPTASVRDMALFVLLSGIAGSLMMMLLLLGVIWWLFNHFVTRPVASLEKTFLAYANGNLAVRARPHPHAAREVRSLALSFNRMARSFAEINQNLLHAAARERALRRELHHRVNNNMQIILGLLNLEARAAGRDEDISQLNNLIQRVLAIAIVHRRFYEGLRTDMIDFTTSLEDLLERLRGQDNASALVKRLKLEAASCELPIDQAVPLALLVCEWVRALNHIRTGPEQTTGTTPEVTPVLRLSTDRLSGQVSMTLTGIENITAQDYATVEDVSQKLVNVLRKQLGHRGRGRSDSLWEISFQARGSSGI